MLTTFLNLEETKIYSMSKRIKIWKVNLKPLWTASHWIKYQLLNNKIYFIKIIQPLIDLETLKINNISLRKASFLIFKGQQQGKCLQIILKITNINKFS